MKNQDLLNNISFRAAALIIKDNKLLMAKNEKYSCYYTVGGGIKANETSQEAVIREVFEETGVKVEIDRLVFVQERFYEVERQKHHEIVFLYLTKDNSNMNIIDNSYTDQGTKESLHWLPIHDLDKKYIVPDFLKIKLLNNLGSIEHIISKE